MKSVHALGRHIGLGIEQISLAKHWFCLPMTFSIRCHSIRVHLLFSTYPQQPLLEGWEWKPKLCLKVLLITPTTFAKARLVILSCLQVVRSMWGGWGGVFMGHPVFLYYLVNCILISIANNIKLWYVHCYIPYNKHLCSLTFIV